ncbi:MAG: BolA family transcriptional regulator [Burkholderiales bacterium]|nr:BolA family transcriptional regulator [Burkholderiales bacterium]
MTMDERIRARLAALAPLEIDVRDDSAAHAGHAGAAEGGHYTVTVVAERFAGCARVARHRLVYDALGPLMGGGIHALALTTLTPAEAARLRPDQTHRKETP